MRFSRLLLASLVVIVVCIRGVSASSSYGARGAEGGPLREQTWLVPTPEPERPARAVLYRPSGEGPFRLAVIAHASSENALRRVQMPQPRYPALAAFLVARGYAVLVPERLGHGATGGDYLEGQGGCDDADYAASGRATAQQIARAAEFLRGQPFIRRDGLAVIGHSAGGWGALALAGSELEGVAAIIVFAPGRGGHADEVPGQICAPDRLVAAASAFGKGARVAVTWLVAANDSYFPPELSRQLADAFRSAGGRVDFQVLAAFGPEGHFMAESEEGVGRAAPLLEQALRLRRPAMPARP